MLSLAGVCASLSLLLDLRNAIQCTKVQQPEQAIAFFVGYFTQDITLALKVGLAGTAVTFVAIVPPWPFFNKHPVKWLPVGGGQAAAALPQNIVIDEKMFTQ